jgi:hypothetical protein
MQSVVEGELQCLSLSFLGDSRLLINLVGRDPVWACAVSADLRAVDVIYNRAILNGLNYIFLSNPRVGTRGAGVEFRNQLIGFAMPVNRK